MDLRTSRLIVFVFGVVVVAVTAVVYYGYAKYVRHPLASLGTTTPARLPPQDGRPVVLPSRGTLRDVSIQEQMRRVEQLRALLERKTAQLEQKQVQLAEQTDQNQQLQRQVDRYLDLLVQLLSEQLEPAAGDEEAGDVSEVQEPALTALPSYDDLELELTAVTLELQRAQQQIGQLESTALLETQRAAVATSAVIDTGGPAVPVLVTLMTHDDPAVRQWAVTALGRIGPAAAEATGALVVLLEDEDAQVRQSARAALQQIEVGF